MSAYKSTQIEGSLVKRCTWLLAALIFISLTRSALADTIQLSVNSSFQANLSSPNDNWWGQYYSWAPQAGDLSPSIGIQAVGTTFSNVSLVLPKGSLITSAQTTVIVPTTFTTGTGFIFPIQGLPKEYPDAPSIPATFSTTGTSDFLVEYIFGVTGPMINDNQVSIGNLDLVFSLIGNIQGSIITPGSNWASWIGGEGQVDLPYTVQLDVTYTPVPEPSSLMLLGTGALGLLGAARRKFFFHP